MLNAYDIIKRVIKVEIDFLALPFLRFGALVSAPGPRSQRKVLALAPIFLL